MQKNEYLDINKKIEEGEMVPFYIIKNYMDYKMCNDINVDKLINFYRINDSVSYNYLKRFDSKNKYSKFKEEFNKFKFSLSQEHLKEISKKLIKEDYEEQKKFIELEPNKFFIYIYNELKNLIESQKDENWIRQNLHDLVTKWNGTYKEINQMILFPTLIASQNYCYNKLIFDFIHRLQQFLKKKNDKKKRKSSVKINESDANYESEDKSESDVDYESKNEMENEDEPEDENKIELENEEEPKYVENKLNKKEAKIKEEKKIVKFTTSKIENTDIKLLKKKRSKSENSENSDDKEYISYDNDKEFIESFQKLLVFLTPFKNVFEIISENKNDELNILRLQIFIFNLNLYEEERREYDTGLLNYICNVLQYSVINEQILDRCDIYYNNKKITKSEWKDIKIDDMVNIDINGEVIERVKIKYFNSKILELNDFTLKLVLKFNKDNDDYLSIYGLRMRSFIFKSSEIEEILKKYLFNLISSNIIKEGFEKFDKRFDHKKQKYPFQGEYKNEIFNEIWRNIIVIPFIYKNTVSETFRDDYKIFLDLNPLQDTIEENKINILFAKLIDLYHEIFHIIGILYAVNMNEYEKDNYSTIDSIDDNKSNEIKEIINKYGDKYPNDMKIMKYKTSDMGDIMEIYFFGIKPYGIALYGSIFLSYILNDNKIEGLIADDIKTELLNLNLSNETINIKQLKEYISKEHTEKNKLYEYFKNSLIYKLFEDSFSSTKIISNSKYKKRGFNKKNNIICNIFYYRYRKPCSFENNNAKKK